MSFYYKNIFYAVVMSKRVTCANNFKMVYFYLNASLVIMLTWLTSCALTVTVEPVKEKQTSRVEIRAVLIKCEPEDGTSPFVDSEMNKFQREELFKHNVLHDCKKKLALAIKLNNEPIHLSANIKQQSSVDEYIPIEHVIGVNKRRQRLLNPYVVRVRRQLSFESYQIRRLSNVNGFILNNMNSFDKKTNYNNINRKYRDLQIIKEGSGLRFTKSLHKMDTHSHMTEKLEQMKFDTKKKDENNINPNNLMHYYDKTRERRDVLYDDDILTNQDSITTDDIKKSESKTLIYENNEQALDKDAFDFYNIDFMDMELSENIPDSNITLNNKKRKEFNVYEIDNNPNIIFSTRIQLFEKLSTPEGKTVWNDMTKDETASVSTENPKWSNEEVSINYKPTEYISRDAYTLPQKRFYLMLPKNGPLKYRGKEVSGVDKTSYIIVSQEDVILINEDDVVEHNSKSGNVTDEAPRKKGFKRFGLQNANSLTKQNLKGLHIINKGSKRYIRLPFKMSHRARIDVEAVADDNDLIIVGCSGGLITIVSDTRRTRSTLDVQVKNTGLAAAKFKVIIRDCSPDIVAIADNNLNGMESAVLVIPPHHTHTFSLKMPFVSNIDSARCTVALVNNNAESVAVRDVRLKRGDRCFCVWHCDCVCLGEDPKLLCESMSATQVAAAGLPAPQMTHRLHAICYPDVVYLNICVTVFGVLLSLLFLGLIKACFGLFCRAVGSWGLREILQTPRNLDHYYESSLKCRTVVYDDEGWPVHPDTRERTVRLVSKPLEYILNTIYFVILPCVIIWSVFKYLISRPQPKKRLSSCEATNNIKKCFSSDVQNIQRRYFRRRNLRKWMTPEAEDLTNQIWNKERPICGFRNPEDQQWKKSDQSYPCMEPLLICPNSKTDDLQSSCLDSEQDDTEYVLMKMQKSSASLSKNQSKRRRDETGTVTPEKYNSKQPLDVINRQ